jgi:tetratricopeptide (TPR) repeat protein
MTTSRRLRILIVFLVVVGLAAAAVGYYWSRPQAPEPPTIETAGFDASVARAIETAREKVRTEPGSATAWGELGSVLFAHDLYPESLPCFEQAERLDPHDARWPYFQGLVHMLAQSLDQALACLERAIERSREVSPRVRRAEVLLGLERLDEARAAFEEVRRREPGHARAALGLGQIAARQGKWDEAAALLTPLVDDPTCRWAARSALAEAAARRGDTTAAADHRQALNELPRDVPWIDPYMEAVQRRKVGLFHRLDLAKQMIARRQFAEAEELLLDIVRTEPKADEAYLNLAKLHLSAGNFAQAEEAAKSCLSLVPRDPNAHFVIAAARFQQKEFARAEQEFQKVVELHADHAVAHYFIGECRRNQNDRRGAMEKYREALRYQPNLPEAHKAIGSILLEQGDKTAARTHLQTALRLRPNDSEARRLLEKTE